ncbi:hypothetical protein [Pandoraea bronchicola]|uniref:hypothetical protein n=1 Tax=Pandoraea bronchicola TaxID=2508287 RepID=UPI0012422F7D|nr:hypothetical protein [Pandoraea bronchicola]
MTLSCSVVVGTRAYVTPVGVTAGKRMQAVVLHGQRRVFRSVGMAEVQRHRRRQATHDERATHG